MYLYWLMFYGAAVYAMSRILDTDLQTINFAKAFRGKKLNGSVFQEISVDSEVSCQIACVKETRCLSYNFASLNEEDNFTCQLSASDRFTNHENFTGDDKMLYRGIQVNFSENWRMILNVLSFYRNCEQMLNVILSVKHTFKMCVMLLVRAFFIVSGKLKEIALLQVVCSLPRLN